MYKIDLMCFPKLDTIMRCSKQLACRLLLYYNKIFVVGLLPERTVEFNRNSRVQLFHSDSSFVSYLSQFDNPIFHFCRPV